MSDIICTNCRGATAAGCEVCKPYRIEAMSDHIATPKNTMVLAVRVAELESRLVELEKQREEAEHFASNTENWITRAEQAEKRIAELEARLEAEKQRDEAEQFASYLRILDYPCGCWISELIKL